jgi:hypothetical protein
MNLKNQLLTGDSAAINATWMTLTRLSRMWQQPVQVLGPGSTEWNPSSPS